METSILAAKWRSIVHCRVALRSQSIHDSCSVLRKCFLKHAQDTFFSHVPTSLTNCFAEYEHRTLYGALVVTLVMLLGLKNCRVIFIIIIIIIKSY